MKATPNASKITPLSPKTIDLDSVRTGRNLDKAITTIILLTAFLQPLIKYENEFIWLKICFNQVVLTIMTLLFLLKVRYLGKIEIPRGRALLPVAAMILIGFLSITQSENLYRSFDYCLRIGANILYYFYFLIHIRTKKHFQRYLWAILGAAFIVAMYGILQFFEIFGVPYDIYQEKDPSSTIGLTNFCSEYLITIIPIVIFGFFMEDFKGLKPVMVVLFIPVYFYFLITKARAAWLGFIFSGLLSLILIFFRWRKEEGSLLKNKRYLLFLAGVLAFIFGFYIYIFVTDFKRELDFLLFQVRIWYVPFLIGLIMIGSLYYYARRQTISRPFYLLLSLVVIGVFVLSFSSYGKLKQFRSIVSSLQPDSEGLSRDKGTLPVKSTDPSIDFRFQAWMSTFNTFLANPVLGVGLGNLETAIHPYQVPKLQKTISKTYQVFSEAHNDYLHILSEVGILGFGAFLWFLIELARVAVRILKRPMSTDRFLMLLGTQAGLIGVLIAAVFSFPLQEPASSMNFWFLAAFLEIQLLGFVEDKAESPREYILPIFQPSRWLSIQKAVYYILIIMTIAGMLYLPLYTFRYAMAENDIKEGIALRNQRMWSRAEVSFSHAIKGNPRNYIYYFHRAIVRYNMANMKGTEEDLIKCLKLSPRFGLAYRILGGVYFATGKLSEAVDSFKLSIQFLPPISLEVSAMAAQGALELRRPDDVIFVCETGLRYDPNRWDLLTYLGKGYYIKGDLKRAKESFQRAVSINPRSFEPQLNLGLTAIHLKDLSVSKGALDAAMALNPTSAALWFGFAMFHSLEGKKGEALEALKKAVLLDPKLTDTARMEPAFESIRGERRFQSLLQPLVPKK